MTDAKIAEWIDKLMAAASAIGAKGAELWPQIVGLTFYTSLFWVLFHFLMAAAIVLCLVRVRRALLVLIKACEDFDRESDPKQRRYAFDPTNYAAARFVTELAVWAIGTLGVAFAIGTSVQDVSGVFFPEARTVLDLAARLR